MSPDDEKWLIVHIGSCSWDPILDIGLGEIRYNTAEEALAVIKANRVITMHHHDLIGQQYEFDADRIGETMRQLSRYGHHNPIVNVSVMRGR